MARSPQVLCAEVAQHVRQRGSGRQFLLASAADPEVRLDLRQQAVWILENEYVPLFPT